MDTKTSHHLMNSSFSFRSAANSPTTVQLKELTLSFENDELTTCRINFSVSYDLYQEIDEKEMFNLYMEERGSIFGGSFTEGQDVEIEASLDEDYLPYLLESGSTASEAAHYLQELSQKQAEHPLLNPNNWYGLYVRQTVPLPADLDEDGAELKVGYSTLWAQDLQADAQSSTAASPPMNMMELISNYLKNEGWSFSQVAGRNALEFDYQGQYSSWTCYALAKPEYDECSFFSVYPDNISKANHVAIVEYITRANYGLPVGNFEMDWDSGELRFKTSLDFEGDRLSEILLNRLVKTNLFLMDKYTFGINKILKEGKTPGEALRIVDGS